MHQDLLPLLLLRSNSTCVDCRNPNPQWASLSFAIFLCLNCAGIHRSFGVHVSFVRSVSMDAWQPDQLRRMQLGGNAPFIDFMRDYSSREQGGYSEDMDPHALYHSWAATQYREKLDYTLAGKPWSPSPPPPPPARPSSAQGLRKSRASARSPPFATPPLPESKNEAYFTSLGIANAARPTHLPPSQGGRYQGFGNTPSPTLTSAATPSLFDFQENPAAALTKGWSLFSAVLAGASRTVNDTVIQPSMDRVMDPNLHSNVRDYLAQAHKHAQVAGTSINHWSKLQLGVDVADHVNTLVGTIQNSVAPGPSGYTALPLHDDSETSPTSDPSAAHVPTDSKVKKDDDWDEWQDF